MCPHKIRESYTMATFKQYTKSNGTKAWQFQSYLGINPMTGKPVKTTRRGFKTKKEAQLELNRLLVDFENKEFNRDDNIKTFEELYHVWFKQHSKDLKQTTIQRIKQHFDNHILPKFGSKRIDKITPLYCQECLNGWAEHLATYKQLKTYTSMVFKYGILINLIQINPMERTITPKRKRDASKKESDSFYTKEELIQFFHCLEQLNDKRAFTFFRVLAFLGLRKGEAMALTWKDFNFDDNTVTIDKTLVELQDGSYEINTTKTESSNRTISIDQQTISILKDWRSHIKRLKLSQGIRDKDFASSLVFSNSVLYRDNQYLSKAYPNNVLVKVKKHFPEMKIIKVHDFRKTNASLLFESGASIKDVAQRLGHQSTKTTTDIYVKVTPTKQNETINIFEKYMAF